jgi:methionyl-tRNA formyltransferase
MNVIFFGSFLEYSVEVLKGLLQDSAREPINVIAVVTTPPMPAGRKQELQFTHVHEYAKSQSIPVFTPAKLTQEALTELASFGECDYFVTAGYGKLLPVSWLEYPKLAALNVHFSLLPKYRGANPGEWAIVSGENETGISVIEMSAQFDTGAVIAQAGIPITDQDTRETIYQQLYALGGETIQAVLQTDYLWRTQKIEKNNDEPKLTFSYPPVAQTTSPTPYARRLTKEDSWISPKVLNAVVNNEESSKNIQISKTDLSPFLYSIWTEHWQSQNKSLAEFIEHAVRALTTFPCIWTTVETSKGEKRFKIFSGTVRTTLFIPEMVQIEGQQKAQWNQVKNSVKLSE